MRIWRNRQTRMVQVHVSIALMQVQLLLSAPNGTNPNLVPIGEGFGFVLLFACPDFNAKIDSRFYNGTHKLRQEVCFSLPDFVYMLYILL